MAASKEQISEWFDKGRGTAGTTHMIIVCDTFDHEDYPVYVFVDENIIDKCKKYDKVNMQRIMEVYDLCMPKDIQLEQPRSFNY